MDALPSMYRDPIRTSSMRRSRPGKPEPRPRLLILLLLQVKRLRLLQADVAPDVAAGPGEVKREEVTPSPAARLPRQRQRQQPAVNSGRAAVAEAVIAAGNLTGAITAARGVVSQPQGAAAMA